MDKSKSTSKKIIMNIISVICIFIFFLLPTSNNGEIIGVGRVIFVWSILSILVIIIGLVNEIKYTNMTIFYFLLLGYMIIVTLLAQKNFDLYHISLARIAPIVVLTYVSFIKIINIPSFSLMKNLLHFFCIICIIWNLGIMFNIDNIIKFTYNNYSQYVDTALYYSVLIGHKPVMSFGVHTYASYFYFIFFLLSYYTYEKLNKRIFLFYSIMLTIFCLFLVSTTSIIFFVAMVIFLIYKTLKKCNTKRALIILFFMVVLVFIIASNFNTLYEKLYKNITGGENSFISRYSNNSVFVENFKIISSSLGIGFNVIDELELGYSDSGYIVYLTMGSIPLLVMVYYRLYKFLDANINNKYKKAIMLIIFSFEFALPASTNYRFIVMILFVICYLNALTLKSNKETNY